MSAVHSKTKTILDITTCRAIGAPNNLHCPNIGYRHSDCYLQDTARNDKQLLNKCNFLKPPEENTHFPISTQSGSLLFSKQQRGTLSVDGQIYHERPLLVDGCNISYKVFESTQKFQLLGRKTLITTRFDQNMLKNFQAAVSIIFPAIKVHWVGICISQALSLSTYAILLIIYVSYRQLRNRRTAKKKVSNTRPSTDRNKRREEVRRQTKALLETQA